MHATKMLELSERTPRFFNVDESVVNDLSWNQKQWQQQGTRICISKKVVSPRLSFIVAIDNFGSIYMALTQVNTDKDVFMLFLEHLAAKLTAEGAEWQASTYFLIDGASYHKAEETMA